MNKKNFTKPELNNAELVRDLHHKLGAPGYNKFFRILEHNYICNYPITIKNVRRALHIHRLDMSKLKCNMICKKPLSIDTYKCIHIPQTIMDFHPTVNFSTD